MPPVVELEEVLWNVPLGTVTAAACLRVPSVAVQSRPGQFVQLRLTPLLRRPFTIAAASGTDVCIVYKVVGEGTRNLRSRREGQAIEVLGPLGKPFELCSRGDFLGDGLLFVSGGAGIAGVLWLAFLQCARGLPAVVLHGQRSDYFMDVRAAMDTVGKVLNLSSEAISLRLATDDGSSGFRGSVVELLVELWQSGEIPRRTVLGCGPRPMLRALKAACAEFGVGCYLAMEERMGCGFGTCLGCAVPLVRGGYAHVCTDGPVFPAEEVEV